MGVTGADEEVDGDVDAIVDDAVEEAEVVLAVVDTVDGVVLTVDTVGGAALAVDADKSDTDTDDFADANVVTVVAPAEP